MEHASDPTALEPAVLPPFDQIASALRTLSAHLNQPPTVDIAMQATSITSPASVPAPAWEMTAILELIRSQQTSDIWRLTSQLGIDEPEEIKAFAVALDQLSPESIEMALENLPHATKTNWNMETFSPVEAAYNLDIRKHLLEIARIFALYSPRAVASIIKRFGRTALPTALMEAEVDDMKHVFWGMAERLIIEQGGLEYDTNGRIWDMSDAVWDGPVSVLGLDLEIDI